jgi:hypothetical protein
LLLANNNFFFNVSGSGTAFCSTIGGCQSPSYIYTGASVYAIADSGGGGLVVVDRDFGKLVQFNYAGGSAMTLATGILGRGVAVTGGLVFWADDGTSPITGYIGRAQLSFVGSGVQFVPNQVHPHHVAADANNIYWTVDSSDNVYDHMDVWTCPYKDCNVSTMKKLAVSEPDIGSGTLQAIASDGTNLYWGASRIWEGYVAECAVGGCNQAPTILTQLAHPRDAGAYAYFAGVTYDASWVYFGVLDGPTTRIGKVAK